ncbi:hypothetical protein SBOR_7203 [Sclerotinia borealis F-4128]|uniref:Nucleoporin NUP53 n=1 Tax=Sclerotinia borealis (strain F-4128) TaxID=1432307 RepID=W9CCY8_SCLBF|nr:hypothetical protein SBOR_7203 [Sclerotinia borealis F-4128]
MPPLILHNVPDEECYVGEDGVKRPYAMLFPGNDGHPGVSRIRRTVPETGSFGKSTRRSRSRTGTPALKKEDPTLAAADAIFAATFARRAAASSETGPSQRKSSIQPSLSQNNLRDSNALAAIDGNAGPSSRFVHKEPTEVILRGFTPDHQWAAIGEYERIAGHVCEDYPRDPPLDQRRYKTDLRDPAVLRRRPMTTEEKAKALKYAGGKHWIKITFESAEAADAAIEASPQAVLGHLVHVELYRGAPPAKDEPGMSTVPSGRSSRFNAYKPRFDPGPLLPGIERPPQQSGLTRAWTTPEMSQVGRSVHFEDRGQSPEGSQATSHTIDTTTLTASTITGGSLALQQRPTSSGSAAPEAPSLYCRGIPTAHRLQLLPADQALLPQKSYTQQVLSNIPLLNWFNEDIIGDTVPRTDTGEFDWAKASLYWKMIYWLDTYLSIFGVAGGEKED